MNANYREYQSALEAQQRITDVRSVVAGQFSGIGDILHDWLMNFATQCGAITNLHNG